MYMRCSRLYRIISKRLLVKGREDLLLSYLAIAATRTGRAFGLRRQFAGDRIATRIVLLAFLDRSAVALFPVVDYPVSA